MQSSLAEGRFSVKGEMDVFNNYLTHFRYNIGNKKVPPDNLVFADIDI